MKKLTLQSYLAEQWQKLHQLALNLTDLKNRLAQRGVPESILNYPAIGFDYLPEKLQRWGLLK